MRSSSIEDFQGTRPFSQDVLFLDHSIQTDVLLGWRQDTRWQGCSRRYQRCLQQTCACNEHDDGKVWCHSETNAHPRPPQACCSTQAKMGINAQGIHSLCCMTRDISHCWLLIRVPSQDVADLLWQFRTNAGVISGRLKREYIHASSFLSAPILMSLSIAFSILHRGVADGSAEYWWEIRRKISLSSRKSPSVAILHDSQWNLL